MSVPVSVDMTVCVSFSRLQSDGGLKTFVKPLKVGTPTLADRHWVFAVLEEHFFHKGCVRLKDGRKIFVHRLFLRTPQLQGCDLLVCLR